MRFGLPKQQHSLVKMLFGAFFLFLLFGAMHCGVFAASTSAASDCPFAPGHTAICEDNSLAHADEWQDFLLFVPSIGAFQVLLLLALAFIILAKLVHIAYKSDFNKVFFPQLFDPEHKPFHPLQEAFSSGILNPKLY